MNWNRLIRQGHRWLSMAFMLMVVLNLIVMGKGDVALWVGTLTLVPLVLLMASGLYLFVLPYAGRARRVRPTAGS